jgi:hypothetical protein
VPDLLVELPDTPVVRRAPMVVAPETVISLDCSGLVMKIVLRVQKRDLISGVGKHPLHQDVF